MSEPTRAILDASGRPARATVRTDCPRCHAPASERVASAGFGSPHDVCRQCGHEFDVLTVTLGGGT